MSGGLDILALQEADVTKMLAAGVHLGASNADFQMLQYVYKRKSDGTHIINLKKTWEKLLIAARIIVAIENPADVCVISGKTHAQRAILKFAGHTGATPVAGRFTPGAFTNQIQAAFREPRLLIISDPRIDHQAINESSYVNIPTIAFCNTDATLRHIDVAIPCNTKAPHSVGLMWWMLAREVLRLRGTITRENPWERTVMPDLYFYRDPDEVEKEEREAAAAAKAASTTTGGAPAMEEWGAATDDWAGAGEAQVAAPAATSAAAPVTPATPAGQLAGDNWGQTASTDWSADPAEGGAGSTDWAASSTTETANW